MNKPAILLLSQFQLAVARFGIIRSAAFLLFLFGLIGWSWIMPRLQAQLDAQRQIVTQARAALAAVPAAPAVPPRTPDEERLAHFYDSIGARSHAEQQLKTLFAIAEKNGLTLSQAEYKPGFNKHGIYHTYQVSLPVKGRYEAIRQFGEQVLHAIPFASLDEMSFKRESIGAHVLEARLRFTLYLAGNAASDGANHEETRDE